MILKIKDILTENSKITVDKLKEFFSLGLELGIFKVIGNEGSEIIYQTNENKTVTGHEFYSTPCPASPRTLNLGSSTWNVLYRWQVYADNLTLNAGTSTININYNNTNAYMDNYRCTGGNYTLNYNNVFDFEILFNFKNKIIIREELNMCGIYRN